MFRSRNTVLQSGKKIPVEGLFCMYNHRKCACKIGSRATKFCMKHILEDKNAPFKQCSYTSNKNSKRCTNAAPKSERKDGLCVDHTRRSMLIRQRNSRKKRPKESPETLLEGLDHHFMHSRGHNYDNHESKKIPSVASKALEYASSSDSDAETPVIDQAWKDEGDSDAESVDSELEDPLKHAEVYTAEEVALVMRDKLIRLQSLYIEQFKRLQHVMKERRRKYLHTVGHEKDSFGAIGQYSKDLESQENWSRYTAMKRYHRRYGMEALLHRQSKERRIAASDGSNYKPPVHSKCSVHANGEKCSNPTLPLSKYCFSHILHDPHQVLYRPCSFGDGTCSHPVATCEDVPCCTVHPNLNSSHDSTFGNDSKNELNATDDIIDVTNEAAMETNQSSEEQATSRPCSRQGPQLSEEELLKKGKLLLQHLKSSDSS